MTVSTQTTRIAYAGDGTSVAFAVPFPFFDAVDLEVLRRVIDQLGGLGDQDRAARRRLAEAGVDVARR